MSETDTAGPGEPPEDPAPPASGESEPRPETLPVDKTTFGIAAAVVLAVIVLGAVFPDDFETASTAALDWVIGNFGWLFIIAGNVFLVLAVYIAVSRFGNIRLGNSDEEPEFGTLPWIAMMFAAGMGIGLMFFGVAEPLSHYFTVPPPLELEPDSTFFEQDRQRGALIYTYFHWVLHPWAIYAVAGLALAYSTFRKRRGNNLSDAFLPLTEGRRWGPGAGRAIDLMGIFATVFGTAASLGFGALQVAVGLDLVAGVPGSTQLELIVIAALTAAFVASAFSGVHRGVKWLSTANVVLAAVIMAFVFFAGPTLFLLDAWPSSVGSYLSGLMRLSSVTGAFGGEDWMAAWTIFYWAWWLSWAPFVGTFIARISRGRSVRQFITGVLLVPSTASTVWFAVMGGTAIWNQANTDADYGDAVAKGEEYAMFALLESLPLYAVVSGISMLLVANYFVTSADSASLVLGSLSSSGSLTPKKPLVVFWGLTIGAVAAVLLLSGGLEGLKNATIIVALPFMFVMLLLCVALMKELREDPGGSQLRYQLRHKGFREAIRRLVGEEVETRTGPRNPWGRGRMRPWLGTGRRNGTDDEAAKLWGEPAAEGIPMKAIVVEQTGGPGVMRLLEGEDPGPRPGQIAVKVAAAGVNFIDVYHRTGAYGLPLPFTPGLEGGGYVAAVGAGVTEFAVGDEVAWKSVPGSYADLVVGDADQFVAVPEKVAVETAAAVMLQGLTAHYLCNSVYDVQEGDTVIVHAAAGGMGLLLTQMVKVKGGKVIATVSTDAKAELARQNGADHVMRYEGFGARARELTGGEGVAAVYDGVGKATFDEGLGALRRRGVMALFGQASGPVPPVDPQALHQGGSLVLTRPTLVDFTATREEYLHRAAEVFQMIEDDNLLVRVGEAFRLEEAPEAHQALEDRRTTGKLLLVP